MTGFSKNFLIAGSFLIIIVLVFLPYIFEIPNIEIKKERKIEEQNVLIPEKKTKPEMDASSWKTYQSKWFGFEVKYPENWKMPVVKKSTVKDKWEYRYIFRKAEEDSSYLGFDVVVYNTKEIKRVMDSEEFPSIKSESPDSCNTINGHLIHEEGFSLEEIYIFDDDCFDPTLFYAFTNGNYAYNIVPIGQKTEEQVEIKEDIIKNFPEFFSVASSFNIIEIKRPRSEPISIGVVLTGRTKKVNGFRVCAEKKHHPTSGSKRHMDEDCCMDRDETPNPKCRY